MAIMAVVKGSRRIRYAAGVSLALAMIPACARPTAPGMGGARAWRGGYVVLSADLAPDRPLHESLVARVPGLRIVEDAFGCPVVLLRRGYSPVGGARIVMNGVQVGNRCLLRDLPPFTVDRVEVFPPGTGGVPGQVNSGAGVVLIFLRDR